MATGLRLYVGIALVALSFVTSAEEANARRRHAKAPAPVVQTPLVDKAAQEAARAQIISEQPGFIAELAQVDAELQVAVALYQTGHVDLANVHVHHTDAIIYRKLQSRMAARRASSFATEFNALTKAIAAKESFKSVQGKYSKLRTAMIISRGPGDLVAAHPMVTAALIMLQKSNEFYSSGVVNGKVEDARHYQDAWGLMKAAKNIMMDISRKDRKLHEAPLKDIDDAMAGLNALWPSLTGTDTNGQDAQMLSDAMSKVEQAGLAIQ
jgi:hypothetical protein